MTIHKVSSEPEREAAMAAAQPGDVVQLTASVRGSLYYRGGMTTPACGAAPIIITADPDVWVGPPDRLEAADG
jgi:hypothetical protein